jgi:catechol 2,3-dioxygenase-like lactoylglutathione lyase family enzyme
MKFNSLVPELDVRDFERSLAFYVGVLGFEVLSRRADPDFALLAYGDAQLMIEQAHEGSRYPLEEGVALGHGVNFQIRTDDVSGIADALRAHGAPLQRDLYDRSHVEHHERITERELRAYDPDGYVLRFSQLISREPID